MSDSNVDKLFNFINTDVTNDNIKLIMTLMVILCILALLFFLIENDIITGKFVIFFIVISIFIYMYNNRQYKDRINILKKQVGIDNISDILTNMCNNSPDSELCNTFYNLQKKYDEELKNLSN